MLVVVGLKDVNISPQPNYGQLFLNYHEGAERPLLVVVGLKDVNISPQPHYGQLFLNYHEGAERLVAVDGDHLFDVMTEQGPAVMDDVIAWSLAWLQQTLPGQGTR